MTADELRAELREVTRAVDGLAFGVRDSDVTRRCADRLRELEQRILLEGIQPEEVRK